MSKRALCKFFAHGACLKGEHCEFSHDWKAPSNNVCTFYQKGMCSYGNRCRYQHVKVNRMESAASSSANGDPAGHLVRKGSSKATVAQAAPVKLSASSVPFFLPGKQVWTDPGEQDLPQECAVVEPRNVKPEDLPLCSFAASGDCPRGDKCSHVHGDLCPTCGKPCLHPFRAEERDRHLKSCEKKQKHLEALKHSQEIECSVCLDRVLSKSTAAERKFGLLSECDHPFCISCIRNWRNSSPSSGVDVNTAVRACPICRKVSYFVIPSVIWYTSKDEKEEIVDNYKAKLRSIDCKHFDFGNGNCPFGTSCFYKHTVRPGSYTWKYQRPPPRRRRPSRYDAIDLLEMEELCDLFEHLMEGDLDAFDADDYAFDADDYEDYYDGIDLAYILTQSFGSSDSSSDDENHIF